MSYGRLNPRQLAALEPHVRDQHVWDLGAGDLFLSHELVRLGASGVTAVDKERLPPPLDPRVKTSQASFDDLLDCTTRKIVFLSWPLNHPDVSLLILTMGAETVIYLGSNLDGQACGFRSFFEHLLHRELVTHEPDRLNTLIVCGDYCPRRAPTWEEHAALNQQGILRYSDYPSP